MTSANRSEEPLVYDEEEACRELADIADALLTHDRDIARPCDDSVLAAVGETPVILRRARGFVPRSIPCAPETGVEIFAAGPHEKNTFCVYKEGKAFVSHHIGDLGTVKSLDAYVRGVDDFLDMFRVTPRLTACDLHPDYESTRFAEDFAGRRGLPLVRVQHHFAHIASVLGENGRTDRVIGVAFDGTGYGADGTLWGGEFLLADTGGYERAAHFAAVPMPGGERCVIEIDRMALSFLIEAYGSVDRIPPFPFIEEFEPARAAALERMIADGINCPVTSSCGRLFDAVSSLLGLCAAPSYDAQGPIKLETLAGGIETTTKSYPFDIAGEAIDFAPAIREIVSDIRRGEERGCIARRFHRTVVKSAVDMCRRVRSASNVDTAALSGGVFQNRIVLSSLMGELEREGFSVLFHTLLPPNDGCVSFGQAVAALNQHT
jgi:hydrogenase maturation protein HypF